MVSGGVGYFMKKLLSLLLLMTSLAYSAEVSSYQNLDSTNYVAAGTTNTVDGKYFLLYDGQERVRLYLVGQGTGTQNASPITVRISTACGVGNSTNDPTVFTNIWDSAKNSGMSIAITNLTATSTNASSIQFETFGIHAIRVSEIDNPSNVGITNLKVYVGYPRNQ